MRILTALALSIILSLTSVAQTKTFHPDKPVRLDFKLGSNDLFSSDSMCDKSGDTFVTIFDPAAEDRGDRPLLKFDKSGSLKAEFPSSRKSLDCLTTKITSSLRLYCPVGESPGWFGHETGCLWPGSPQTASSNPEPSSTVPPAP
jgi:hypothetical protein